MAKGKLVLDTVFEEAFALLAIHCSLEPYRLAYFINKHLHLKLHRIKDVQVFQKKKVVEVPLFFFEDTMKQTSFYLVANTFKFVSANETLSDLFGPHMQQTKNEALLPEYKKADYLLKIEDESLESVPLKRILSDLNQIKHIVTAYTIDTDTLNRKERLTF